MKWIIISATLLIILAQKSFSADDTVYASALAMLNERGRLPCDVSSGIPGDRVVLILWYRGTGGTPIYSFDARGNDVDQGTHWTDRSLLQKRAFFQINQDNSWGTNSKFSAHLEIQPVRDQDQAMYRCRVDYLLSPTKNTITNFTVIIPPNKPEIYNTTGQLVGNKKDVSIIGPYNEGSQLILVCKVTGGRPRPVLFWVVKDEVWRTEVEEEIGNSDSLRTTLVIPSLTRNYLHAVFQCQATNFNASAPVTSSVTIDMNFLPLSVNILRIIDPMSSSSDYELVCKTWGSRPPATITWWMDDTQQLKHAVMTTSPNNNVTTSILRYHANVEDNGKHLSCRAENRKIPQSAMDSKLKLNIYFHPLVTLQMGSSLDPESIKEGDDVYFECHINANPPVHRVFWYHNGSPVEHKISHGIIMQNQTLVLQKISRTFAGFYSCRGINSEGEGESQPVNLRVMYKPYCRRQTKNIYGTALHEPASVTCEVEADPSVVTFRWTFNNTSEHLPIPATAVASQGLISVASYAPKSHLDYGTLLCWAFNAIGEQKVPCAFAIIPAGPPDQPKNCSIANQTTDTIEVECSPGFDGGLTQSFYMEVYDSTTGALYTNLSSPEPFFLLTSLRPGIAFLMTTYAANAKGRSAPASIETFTLKVAEKRTVYSITTPGPPAIIEFTPLLGFLLGLVGVLFLVVSVVMLIMKLKGKLLQPQDANQGSSSTEGLTGDAQEKPLHSRAPRDMGVDLSSTSELEEKDPDLIPHKNDNMLSYSNYGSAGPSTPEYPNQLRSNLHSHNGHRSQTLQALRSLKQRQESIEAKIYKNYMKYMKLHAASMDDSEVTYFELPYPSQEDQETYSDVNKTNEPRLLYTPFDHTSCNSPSGNGKSSNNLSTASTTTNSHPHQDALSSSFLPLLLRRNSSIEGGSPGFKICHTSIPNLYATLDYGRGITTSTTSSVINHSTIYATLPHRHKNMFVSTHSISSAASTSLGGSSSSSHPFRDIRLNLRSPLTKHPSESAV